jgi:BirA family biotin operon repressor/biotin-[acetyl-CoA-carboxylase] ligase
LYKIPANTLFIGKNLVFVPECHSTNDLALQLSQQPSTTEGTVVVTDNQTAGRGQRGNTWKAHPGMNLTFSLILQPKTIDLNRQFYLNIFTSLAVYDYLKTKTDADISIKWPNDLLVDGRKLCGILIENQLRGNLLSNTIVGIGLNINQEDFELPMATSLRNVVKKQFDLPNELDKLLSMIEARYLELKQGRFEKMMDDYLAALHWYNVSHIFSSNGEAFEGTITGTDDIGRLKVETTQGTRVFAAKEIVYVR